jgi:DNA-binding NtrC family response regulator
LVLYVQHPFFGTSRMKFALSRWLNMQGAVRHSEWKAESSEVEAPVGEGISGRILIIDDDPHFLHVLQRILSGEKFSVTATSDPCKAIEVLRSGSFDLVICDLRMPDCDGLNLLQAVRGAGSEVPVIILTAYGEVDTYLEAMNAGANEYLNKPIKSDELVQVVRNCLRKGDHRRSSKRPNSV